MKKHKTNKDLTVALVILAVLVALALINYLLCTARLNDLAKSAEGIECGDTTDAEAIKEDFYGTAFLLSVTLNHDDIEEAEEYVIELAEMAKGEDEAALSLAKSRLISAINQLKRLSGIGIDSII